MLINCYLPAARTAVVAQRNRQRICLYYNEQQTSERSDVPPLSNGRLCVGACEKIPRTFAHSVGLFIKNILTSPVYPHIRVSVCLCIEVRPSHTTNAEQISPLVTSVEVPYYDFHPPLPASKTVLSSWSLVVICPLIAPGVTGITGWYDNRLVVPGTRYQAMYTRAQQHIRTRIQGIYRVPEHHLFVVADDCCRDEGTQR